MNKMIRAIQKNNEMKEIVGLNNEQIEYENDNEENNNKGGTKQRSIKNKKMNKNEMNRVTGQKKYQMILKKMMRMFY